MSTQQISALLRENVLGRGQRIDSLTADNTTISGAPAVRLRFTEPASPARRRAVEYGFVKGGYFFYLLFSAVDDPDYVNVLKDFQRIVSTFKVLD